MPEPKSLYTIEFTVVERECVELNKLFWGLGSAAAVIRFALKRLDRSRAPLPPMSGAPRNEFDGELKSRMSRVIDKMDDCDREPTPDHLGQRRTCIELLRQEIVYAIQQADAELPSL